jgi:3-hydroxyisobutyrate dehydrogenase-like beta-hydroxyacid dehydrogenase
MIDDAASGASLSLPLTSTAKQRFGDAVDDGLSEWDIAGMTKLIGKGAK